MGCCNNGWSNWGGSYCGAWVGGCYNGAYVNVCNQATWGCYRPWTQYYGCSNCWF